MFWALVSGAALLVLLFFRCWHSLKRRRWIQFCSIKWHQKFGYTEEDAHLGVRNFIPLKCRLLTKKTLNSIKKGKGKNVYASNIADEEDEMSLQFRV
ncbi:hypothetical protein VNO80_13320 [Phaseolus coccineus]|uniref:Uncharacterized protein n=1 Tax=Phaseolus coccineus TaxID=3886 RepID=A0AAN9N786_PHACN